jgi:MFS family permease
MMADGGAYSLMVGIGETYVPAFVLALGLGDVAAGLIATVPMLGGGLLQLASPWAVRGLGSHRRWVVACAACQAGSLVLLMALALCEGWPNSWLVFVPATVYWAAGLATGPAWNAWVERLVPSPMRATFFAQRTWLSHVCLLVGLVMGGVLLRARTSAERTVPVFGLLFAVAAVSRLLSAAMLARQSEPDDGRYLDVAGASYRDVLRGMRGGAGIKLLTYLLVVQVAVHVAAPYFTPYMLSQLRLSYLQYMVLLSCGFLGKILALPWAGQYARRFGPRHLLWIGGAGIVPLSAMWLLSNAFVYLMVLQIVGGMAWAAYELAMLLLFFETIPREHRVRMLSLYNAGNAAAMVVGAVAGAALLDRLADGRGAYWALFIISSLSRAVALALIPRRPPQPAHVGASAGLRSIAVRPDTGTIERPILPAISDGEGAAPSEESL